MFCVWHAYGMRMASVPTLAHLRGGRGRGQMLAMKQPTLKQTKGIWADMAQAGAEFAVHVTPRARRDSAEWREGVFHIHTTTAPEDGRATAAVAEALAHGLGVAKTRLVLVRGAARRDKVFRLE